MPPVTVTLNTAVWLLPVLVYVVLVTAITIIHILAKPGYVCLYNKCGEKIIDKRKLFLYLILYYFILGVVILIVNRITKKNVK